MIEAIQGAEIAAGPEDVSVASGQPDEALIRACQELIGLERRRIQQEADPMALPAVSALWEKNFRRALDCACSLPALTIEGQRARAEALQLIGGGVADDIEASPTERLSSALARDAMRAPTVSVRNVRVDSALVQACDAFVSALDERNRMRIERDANPSDGRRWADRHASLETRIEMLMQEIVSRRACGPEGRAAQMRALLAAQGPLRSFDELIAHAPDGFGRLVHVVLRDLAAEQVSTGGAG